MEKIQFSLLLKIIGLGSASGLIYHDNTIVGIGDNSTYLYEYHINESKLEKHPLAVISQEATPKEFKSDFEAITQYQDSLYIFGSGSTDKRNKMLKVDATTKKVISTTDLSDLYFSLQSFGEIKPEDFNIEGAIYNGNTWYFFNRGNGKTNQNIVFTVDGKNLTDEYRIVVNHYKLPKIKGVHTSFTDAVLVEDKIYFLATAEDTTSTYEDGVITGSVIGRIDLKTMKIDFTKQITDTHKLEGIALYQKSDEDIEFLLCEDNDTEILESNVYKLKILGL